MKLTADLLVRSWRSWSASDRPAEGPAWLQAVWTALFALPIGLLFTLIGFVFHARGADWTDPAAWAQALGINTFISLCISFAIHGLLALARRLIGVERIRAWPAGRRWLFFSLLPLVGVALGWPVAVLMLGLRFGVGDEGGGGINVTVGSLLFVLMFSALMNLYFTGQARTRAAERREAEARLRLLQGQIEPHFLFNTLANVCSLVESDPRRARLMLEAFVDFLRASFGGLREAEHSLGDELALIRTYLLILGLRMEDRLRTRFDVPPALLGLRLPALLLQPLVENAIQHGLEPKIEGGEVLVQARLAGGRLELLVSDNGLGLAAAPAQRRPGGGHGLANIRARLAEAYGGRASLNLSPAEHGGVEARLCLPLPPSFVPPPNSP